MNRYKYLIFTIVLFLTCITNTYAACTQEEINEFKKVEDDYVVKYEFDKNTKTYNVTFYTEESSRYTYILDQKMNLNDLTEETETNYTFAKVMPGEYKIRVTGLSKECNNILKEIVLKIPEYNTYSEDPLCEGIEEFVLCSPTYNKEITYEEFVSRINTHKKNHSGEEATKPKDEESPEKNEEKKENEFITNIVNYIKTYLLEIIIVTIFIILLIITIIIAAKSIRKSRRLE